MKMVKVKSNMIAHRGICTKTSAGEVTFDERGIAEVPEDVARKLINGLPFISLAQGSELPDVKEVGSGNSELLEENKNLRAEKEELEGKVTSLTEENKNLRAEKEELEGKVTSLTEELNKKVVDLTKGDVPVVEIPDGGGGDPPGPTIEELKKTINKANGDQLKAMATEAGYPEEEWGELAFQKLKKYLIGKLENES